MPKTLRVDIWSDIVCPWCYVGKRRFEAALAQFPHHDAVAVTWRAFELDPSAPRLADPSVSLAQGLARKYGMPLPQADGMLVKMTETAAAEGLDFHFEKARRGNTFDAHRVLHLAGERGVQDAVKERLMRGYFTEGAAVSDPEVLATLGAEAGLDADEVRTVLAAETYAAEVRADEGTAREPVLRHRGALRHFGSAARDSAPRSARPSLERGEGRARPRGAGRRRVRTGGVRYRLRPSSACLHWLSCWFRQSSRSILICWAVPR